LSGKNRKFVPESLRFGMRRVVAISFLLLAHICVLAHAVVPHHRHDRVVVVDVFQHEGADHDHDHQGCEVCVLDNAFTSDEIKRSHAESCACCHAVATVLPDSYCLPEIQVGDGPAFRPKPPIVTYHYQYLTHSLGLRAPPAC